MTVAIIILYFLILLICVLCGFLLWTFHNRVEILAELHGRLTEKVKEGEKVIIENFEIVEKRFSRLEHEVKNAKTQETHIKAKEAIRAARLARQHDSE